MKKILICIMLFVLSFSLLPLSTYAATDETESIPVSNDLSIPSGFSGQNNNNLRWFVYGDPLINTGSSDYGFVSTGSTPSYVSPKYSSNSVHYVNEEMYFLYAEDSVGTVKLEPVYSISSPNNINSSGPVSLTIRGIISYPDNCEIKSDSTKLKNLASDFYTNSNDTIGDGVILYRYTTGNTFSSWNHISLPSHDDIDGITLYFGTGLKVQIAILYRMKEYKNLFQQTSYYICGIYRFNTTNNYV